jgi:type II secretory pathway predicted ATPase ExeA
MLLTKGEAAAIEAACQGRPELQLRMSRLLMLQESMAKNAFGTAAIEGNPLTEQQVLDLLRPRFREAIRKELEAATISDAC